jgi:hypothetical protein
MDFFYERTTYVFDTLHRFWEHERMHRKLAVMLVCYFLGSLLLIELNRRHMLPPIPASMVPHNHFYAIGMAFTVILVLEVLSLIFVLPCFLFPLHRQAVRVALAHPPARCLQGVVPFCRAYQLRR